MAFGAVPARWGEEGGCLDEWLYWSWSLNSLGGPNGRLQPLRGRLIVGLGIRKARVLSESGLARPVCSQLFTRKADGSHGDGEGVWGLCGRTGKAACAFHPVTPQNASFMVLGSIPPVLCPVWLRRRSVIDSRRWTDDARDVLRPHRCRGLGL
jgi:hypothetical protein